MGAGYNARADFFSMDASSDDAIGGAIVTGSLLASNQRIRFEPVSISFSRQETYIQGLETERRFTVMITNQSLGIVERDEMVITRPANHPYINNRFRIAAMSHDSIPGARGHIELLVTQVVESRSLP
jgi:hypothetical protein